MPRRAIGDRRGGRRPAVIVVSRWSTRLNGADRIALRDRALRRPARRRRWPAGGRRDGPRSPPPRRARCAPAGHPRRPVLLCNPWSGGGKVERFGLRDARRRARRRDGACSTAGSTSSSSHATPSHAAPTASAWPEATGHRRSSRRSRSSTGSRSCASSAGTRNHFALDLGLNRDDPRESMYAFRDAVERTRRLRDRQRPLLREQRVARRVRQDRAGGVVPRRQGRHDEGRCSPRCSGGRPSRSTSSSRRPTATEVDGAILVMVSNNPYVIGASPDNAQRRHLDRGELGVFAVTTSTGAEAARLFAASALGQRTRSPFWQEFTATEFEVRSRSGTAFAGIDGEALELPTPLRFRIHPQGLTLLVPARQPRDRRTAPRARRPTSATSSPSPPATSRTELKTHSRNLVERPNVDRQSRARRAWRLCGRSERCGGSIVPVMSEATESSSRTVRASFDSALAYGEAAMSSLFAFARAGARSVGRVHRCRCTDGRGVRCSTPRRKPRAERPPADLSASRSDHFDSSSRPLRNVEHQAAVRTA